MSTTFTNSALVSDALTDTGLITLANGAYSSPSTLVDNTPSGSRGALMRGLIRLTMTATVTAGSGAPYITVYRLAAIDGTNPPTPPGTSATAPSPNALQSIVQLVASAGFLTLDFGPFDLEPFKYAFMFFNSSGASFVGATAMLYRWTPIGT